MGASTCIWLSPDARGTWNVASFVHSVGNGRMNADSEARVAVDIGPVRFVGRQPILDRSLKVYGHEMLFRAGDVNVFSGDVDTAAQSVIDNTLLLMPEGNHEVFFLNCAQSTLRSGYVTLLPPKRTVLEVLETVEPDEDFIRCCQELKARGYTFALDDYTHNEDMTNLLDLAEIIKIDFLASDREARARIYESARGKKKKFLAEKLETETEYDIARKEGCELFQGYFFCRPVMVPTRAIPQSKLIYMRLLAELSSEDADIWRVEQLVMSDTSICYRLLRLVNSALYGLPEPISSIRHALMRIGEVEFRKLVTLALVNAASTPQAKAATRVALERAKFCELLAPYMKEQGSTLYLLGLLSLMDVILGMTMAQVMESLTLSEKLRAALLADSGELNIVVELVREREAGHVAEVDDLQARIALPAGDAAAMHAEAVLWADHVTMLQ